MRSVDSPSFSASSSLISTKSNSSQQGNCVGCVAAWVTDCPTNPWASLFPDFLKKFSYVSDPDYEDTQGPLLWLTFLKFLILSMIAYRQKVCLESNFFQGRFAVLAAHVSDCTGLSVTLSTCNPRGFSLENKIFHLIKNQIMYNQSFEQNTLIVPLLTRDRRRHVSEEGKRRGRRGVFFSDCLLNNLRKVNYCSLYLPYNVRLRWPVMWIKW